MIDITVVFITTIVIIGITFILYSLSSLSFHDHVYDYHQIHLHHDFIMPSSLLSLFLSILLFMTLLISFSHYQYHYRYWYHLLSALPALLLLQLISSKLDEGSSNSHNHTIFAVEAVIITIIIIIRLHLQSLFPPFVILILQPSSSPSPSLFSCPTPLLQWTQIPLSDCMISVNFSFQLCIQVISNFLHCQLARESVPTPRCHSAIHLWLRGMVGM